jgi:hypothetical protein
MWYKRSRPAGVPLGFPRLPTYQLLFIFVSLHILACVWVTP